MTTAARLRRTTRRLGIVAVGAAVVTTSVAAPAVADRPATWPEPEPMSPLMALLIFVGGPLLLGAIITVLTLAPSLIRGDRQRRGVASWTEPEWFGREVSRSEARGELEGREAEARGELPAREAEAAEAETGGASARW